MAVPRVLMLICSVLALAYVGACAYLYAQQRQFLYFPRLVSAFGSHDFVLHNEGETLRILQVGSGSDAVIYFGGNAEDVSENIPLLTAVLPGKSVYLMNYRGYGGSSGAPTEAGLYSDATLLYDFVRKQHPNVALIGRSLGSGVATYVASIRDPAKLVLVTPYDSIENLARRNFPIFPVSLLLKDKFASVARAASIKAPTLCLLAERDDIVPHDSSNALIAAFGRQQVAHHMIPASDHNSIGASPQYAAYLQAFLH